MDSPVIFPPPRPCEAGDESSRYRINNECHDDRNRFRRFFGSPDRWHRRRNDDVYLQTDQLGREAWKSVVLPLGPSRLDADVLIFHIAQLA